ncbi:pentapeptide repeat-containing protein [Actinomycetospora sp. TBRC 11914]|uniref:pentapeptide repeat-containing protein n=1 Tax=Actinomycetospora sp. TBRC 11914 TaxID=2729387 RepID=UPI00145D31D8|nr:pentapeptide repeat-containing protein [Actinomycetospora sp. TBRC 11914]NMO88214.1 pentapeptide repeat-containing protein [Actinomycetospora sp. TBRC 11914]
MAAIATALAAVISALVATAALNSTQRQIEIAEQGQVTDRYTRAVSQLGDPGPDVHLGGIYALERLSHDSPRDQPTILAVLSAYVRNHAPKSSCPSRNPPASGQSSALPAVVFGLPEPPSDVAGALTVLGRRDPAQDAGSRIDLAGACLLGANLIGNNFAGARIFDADLTGANLTDSGLKGTEFVGSKLNFSHLADADLRGADFYDADLSFARAAGANFAGATLRGANLSGADLTGADLSGTDLTGADISSAILINATGANLTDTLGVPLR